MTLVCLLETSVISLTHVKSSVPQSSSVTTTACATSTIRLVPLLIPAGTEGSVEADFWYYSVYLKDGGYNEFIRKQFDTVTVKFRLDEGMIKVRFTDQPSESYRTMEITQYDFDGGKKKVTFTDIF